VRRGEIKAGRTACLVSTVGQAPLGAWVPRSLSACFAYLARPPLAFIITPPRSDRLHHRHSVTTADAMATATAAGSFALRETCGQLLRHLILTKTCNLVARHRGTRSPRGLAGYMQSLPQQLGSKSS